MGQAKRGLPVGDCAIRVDGIAKEYAIGRPDAYYRTFREALMKGIRAPWRRASAVGSTADEAQTFWALRDIGFEVGAGDVLGVIGRNGAGKSTLLKILSRITEPTHGRVEIRGRVASLLEVGTGFHAELTGRENIYLNGAILGMTRKEIERRFDDIVAFAEIERFLDMPVKRYSSGMYGRLAFAVAANLDPEILIVDEVLAVGDADFQSKCLGRMKEFGHEKRTVVFVSHNMGAVRALCNKCLLLEHGRMRQFGPTNEVIAAYLEHLNLDATWTRRDVDLSKPVVLAVAVKNSGTHPDGPSFVLDLQIHAPQATRLAITVRIRDQLGTPVGFGSLGVFNRADLVDLRPGTNNIAVEFSAVRWATGEYTVSLDLERPFLAHYDRVEDCIRFRVDRAPVQGAALALPQTWGHGCLEMALARSENETVAPLPRRMPVKGSRSGQQNDFGTRRAQSGTGARLTAGIPTPD
jgi:lipopolysaccharide transport system ATP-binding protein